MSLQLRSACCRLCTDVQRVALLDIDGDGVLTELELETFVLRRILGLAGCSQHFVSNKPPGRTSRCSAVRGPDLPSGRARFTLRHNLSVGLPGRRSRTSEPSICVARPLRPALCTELPAYSTRTSLRILAW